MDFARDGYAALGGFLSGDDHGAVVEAVDAHVRTPPDTSCVRPNNTLLPLRWNDRIVDIVLGSERRVQALCDAVGADDLRWISGYVSTKDPGSLPLWWHQDWWCWDHAVSFRPAAAQVALLCYLAGTDPGNGALRVLPGSHRRRTPLHDVLPDAHDDAADALDPEDPALGEAAGQQTVSLRAGDAVVLDYRLLHGTHANASAVRRDCVLLSFTPSWSALPQDIRGHLIDHAALPGADEAALRSPWQARLLPGFSMPRRTLTVNRSPPLHFGER